MVAKPWMILVKTLKDCGQHLLAKNFKGFQSQSQSILVKILKDFCKNLKDSNKNL